MRPANGLSNGSIHECESDGEEFSDTYDHIAEVTFFDCWVAIELDYSCLLVQDPSPSPLNGKGDEIISARGEAELTPPRFAPANAASRSSTGRQQNTRGKLNRIIDYLTKLYQRCCQSINRVWKFSNCGRIRRRWTLFRTRTNSRSQRTNCSGRPASST